MPLTGRVVVDASVVVEALGDFTFPDSARRLMEAFADPDSDLELWAPDLVYPEAVSALRGLVLRGELAAEEAGRGIDLLLLLPLEVTGTAALLRDAWQLRDAVTIYDASYASLAARISAPLVTADAALVRTLEGLERTVVFLGDL